MGKTLFMETTQVTAERSASEIVAELIKAGATQINTEYKEGRITGLRWIMKVNGADCLFAMPARVAPVFKILKSRTKGYLYQKQIDEMEAKATRVAWRQLLRWVQAQMAMIQCGMIQNGEAFFPYLQHPSTGRTLFEHFYESGYKALPMPCDKEN